MTRQEEQVLEGLRSYLTRDSEAVRAVITAAKLLTQLRRLENSIDKFHMGRP